MEDKLKNRTMEFLGFGTDEQYFHNLEIYLDNILAPIEEQREIYEYIQTHNPLVLSVATETRIARDMFGGFKYGGD